MMLRMTHRYEIKHPMKVEDIFMYAKEYIHDKKTFQERLANLKIDETDLDKDKDKVKKLFDSYLTPFKGNITVPVSGVYDEHALMQVRKYRIANWEEAKLELKRDLVQARSLTDMSSMGLGMNTNFFSKYNFKMTKYMTTFTRIVDEVFTDYERTVYGGLPVYLEKVWHQSTFKEQKHDIHNHGYIGFSGVLYVDYNKDVHKPTHFVFPCIDPLTGEQKMFIPDVQEGDLLIFPASLNHYQPPSFVDEQRLIISFNGRGILDAKVGAED